MRIFNQRKFTLGVLLCSFVFALQAQEFRQYGTQKVQERLLKANPSMAEQLETMEAFIEEYEMIAPQRNEGIYRIPVVFHLVGVDVNRGTIEAQLDLLNEYFSVLNAETLFWADLAEGYKERRSNLAVQFCLASTGPIGEQTSGIVHKSASVEHWTLDDQIKDARAGGSAAWPTAQYLNIWVGNLADQKAGYAQMPNGPKLTDGIVIDARYLGQTESNPESYNGGKTLVHLMGSYLGLYELWNDENPCQDDFVADTPMHNAPNYDCAGARHISSCAGNKTEMTMNFMDASKDDCLIMFTQGQVKRMHAVLSKDGPRGRLIQTAVQCQTLTAESIDADVSTSLSEKALKLSVLVSPNPADRMITVSANSTLDQNVPLTLSFYDPNQRLVREEKVAANTTINLDCSDWNAGIYTVTTKLGEEFAMQRFVITH